MQTYLCRLIEFTGDDQIQTLTTNELHRFLTWLEIDHKLSKRTIHDAWVHLSSLWTWAETELSIPHILCKQINAPDFTHHKPDPFTAAGSSFSSAGVRTAAKEQVHELRAVGGTYLHPLRTLHRVIAGRAHIP